MAIPKEEREELRAAIKRTSRPTRDYLPTDAADHRLIRAAPQRLLDALDEVEAERIELRAALIASGNAVGASLSDKCSSRFLCLVPAEVTLVYKRITAERGALKAAKDGAYQERDRLVALISKVFPACLARHPDSDTSWDNDWRWIVFVLLPTGQASWHIHDSELAWFKHLPRTGAPEWDGHTTDEKYRRVDAVGAGFFGARMLSENVEEPQP